MSFMISDCVGGCDFGHPAKIGIIMVKNIKNRFFISFTITPQAAVLGFYNIKFSLVINGELI